MINHIYHYNVNSEQRYFMGREHRSLFDMIALNGNIVAYTPKAVAAFVASTGKPFFINPQTHAFQHETINLKRDIRSEEEKKNKAKPKYDFKESVKSLANLYLKEPFSSVLRKDKPLKTSDFIIDSLKSDKDNIENMCTNVAEFQLSILNKFLGDDDREFMEHRIFEPDFILPPYFFISTENNMEWMQINIICYNTTVKLFGDKDVYLPIVISKKVLETKTDLLIETIKNLRPSGILLWVDDYKEENLSTTQIEKLIKLLSGIRGHTEKVYNVHGGYLSILLCHRDLNNLLDGVGHSINYGEYRRVIPVGGGIPMAYFYLPSMHSRLKYDIALDILKQKNWLKDKEAYAEYVCRCIQCRDLTDKNETADDVFFIFGESKESGSTNVSREFPTALAKQVASRHYLYNKAKEFDDLEAVGLPVLLDRIIKSYNEIAESSGVEVVNHLINWHNSLKKYLSKN